MHFHPLFQLQLMGLNGAFLTGDLFNLFVFFEVMLAASYGLLLHGSGRLRVQAGLHYIAINLAASSLFLIGVALLYGVTGTLNMADLGARIAAARRRPTAACCMRRAAILAIAFLAKAGAVAAQLLAGAGLQRGRVAGGRGVRAADQGRRLHGAAAVDRAVRARRRRVGAVRRRACWSAIGLATLFVGALGMLGTQRLSQPGGLQRAGVGRHAAGGHRPRLARPLGRRAVLPAQLDAGGERASSCWST